MNKKNKMYTLSNGNKPKHISPVPLVFKEAHDVAGLGAIDQDLEWVTQCAQRLKVVRSMKESDFIVIESFMIAMMVKYGRCFATGVRRSMPKEIILSLPKKYRERHEYFKNLRDKYIAHSVNYYEQYWTTAYIDKADPKHQKFDSIGFRHERMGNISIKEIDSLIELVGKIRNKLKRLIEKEKKKVLKITKKIPIQELIKHDFPKYIDKVHKIISKGRNREIIKNNS